MPRRNIVNMPRGGFSVRAGGRTVTMKDIQRAGKLARKVSKTVKQKGLLKTVKGLAVKGAKAGASAAVGMLAEKAWRELNKELNQRLDSKTNGRTLVDAPNNLTGPSAPVAAASVVNSLSRMKLANASDDRVIHKTHYETGYPLTAKMKRLLKDNGGTYKVLCDSKIQQQGFVGRNSLTQGNGFNSKRYHVPPSRAQLNYSQVRDLCMQNTIGDLTPTYAHIQTKSAVAKLKQQFMIKNQSVGLPIDFTIHLVRFKDYGMLDVFDTNQHSLGNFLARCFTDNTTIPTTLAGRVPQWYTTVEPIIEGTGAESNFNVEVLPSMKSLNYSTVFRAGLEIVESFNKTLEPGDFWNFSHTHTTGDGIDLQILSRNVQPLAGVTQPSTQIGNTVLKNSLPFTYGVIFETKGKIGEIYYVPATSQIDTYLGTTPTAWAYEYKCSAYYANDQEFSTLGTTSSIPYAYETVSQPSIRNASVTDATKPFFLPFNQIANSTLDEALAGSVGKGYMPVNASTAPSSRIYEGSAPG